MIRPSEWTKTLRDTLSDLGWHRAEGGGPEQWRSPLGFWRLRVETLGKYPGYGWRVWRGGGHGSFFLADEEAVLGWLLVR